MDGDPTPRLLPSLVADKVSGLFMAQAITAALFHRQRSGKGQFVEVPMMECLTSFNLAEHFFGHVYDPPTGQWGYSRVVNPERKPFATKDGYIGLLPYTDQQWEQFFAAAGLGETLGKDPRFTDFRARAANIEVVYGSVEAITRTKTTAEWLALLKPLHIPVTRMNRLDDLMEDPHLAAVGLFERYEHPEAGAYVNMRPPVKFAATPANIRRHPPRLGEHTVGGAGGTGLGALNTSPDRPETEGPTPLRAWPRRSSRPSDWARAAQWRAAAAATVTPVTRPMDRLGLTPRL